MSVRVLIVGFGYVGQLLGQLLKADGHTVYGVKRTHQHTLIDQLIQKDIMHLDDADLPEIDFVVYCPSSDARDEMAYQKVYADGADHVLSLLEQRAHKPRFIYVSSTRVYEQNHGEWVDESAECVGNDPLAKCILSGEARVMRSTLNHMVVRCSGLYGPNRHYLLDALQNGDARLCHSLRFSNRIHTLDCARMLYHMMRIRYNERLYIASDSEPTPINTIVAWLSATTGIALPEMKHDESPEPDDGRSNKKLNNARLLHTGFRFEFSNYRQGFKHILQEKGLLPPPETP